MQSFDAIIVGGGPAGSTCARALRRAGMSVLILDKQLFPRDKICAGWITPQVIAALDLDIDDYRRDNVLQPITGFRTGMIDGPEVHTRYEQPVSYGIRRREFDHYLLQRADVRCLMGEPVRSIERYGDRWLINGDLTAPLLIGAGGNFCPVARLLGAQDQPHASLIVAQEVEFPIPDMPGCDVGVAGDTPELWFCPDLQGYGWCFRKGDYLNIGLGRLDSRRLSTHVQSFCCFLRDQGKIRCSIPDRFAGHAYRLYERIDPKLVDDGVILIGDSAGLAYPQSGEGIRPAIESALLAAQTIIDAAVDYSSDRLEAYESRILERFGRPRAKSAVDWLPVSWLHRLAWGLISNRYFARHVVLDRWFLHSQQPALAV